MFCHQLTAEDVDSPANGDILYSIINGDRDNQFFIDPLSGMIKVNKHLDRETVSIWTIYGFTQTHTYTHMDAHSSFPC